MYCLKCNCDMKFVPAGISRKSGKPYDSFWVCQNPECKATMKDNPVDKALNQQEQKPVNNVNTKVIDSNSMILAYAKDIVVAEIMASAQNKQAVAEPFKRVADGFKLLLKAYKNPFEQ